MKIPILLVALLFAFSAVSHAGYTLRGFKAYKKLCMECHGKPFQGADMLPQREWRKMFEEKAKTLRAEHKENKAALEVIDSTYFKKKEKYLKRFLIENANDTAKAPTCNADVCGDM